MYAVYCVNNNIWGKYLKGSASSCSHASFCVKWLEILSWLRDICKKLTVYEGD